MEIWQAGTPVLKLISNGHVEIDGDSRWIHQYRVRKVIKLGIIGSHTKVTSKILGMKLGLRFILRSWLL